ncbi:unnamed protein product [Kuraishia capsulata CBS 1993]|uniref:Uncharacterized protein n=1 Tax=Kuraishia capsulata CBS 1993 TaxID=1382522 RepID=W6MTX9_9ASCO|nr:uncharacterized protein KUCA_T00004721001 [Kuraishia capsulata CBS 1993]CDK28737.1 unnamed protein product [Kuraishia capsulata CBS 1993]
MASTQYTQRVSFIDPYPTNIDPSDPAHFPPQFRGFEDYHPKAQPAKPKHTFKDLESDLGYGGGSINNIAQHYSTSSHPIGHRRSSIAGITPRRLPEAPAKSILKKERPFESGRSLSDGSVLLSNTFGVASFGSKFDTGRKKSIVEMTDAELLAMDAQFSKTSLNVEDFNFENQPSYFGGYSSNKKGSNTNWKNKFDAVLRGYPTRPTISHGSCCITVKHRDFPVLVSNPEVEVHQRRPSLSKSSDQAAYLKKLGRLETLDFYNRTLLILISGRKHTWNSIDYTLSNLVKDGDRVVIGSYANIQEVEGAHPQVSAAYNEPNDGNEKDDFYERSHNYSITYDEIHKSAQNIMNYALEYIDSKDLKERLVITVDLINCTSSKDVFKDCFKLYDPQLVICGIKNNKPEVGDSLLWYKKKVKTVALPYFLIDRCPTPVLLVDGYHTRLSLPKSSQPGVTDNVFKASFIHSDKIPSFKIVSADDDENDSINSLDDGVFQVDEEYDISSIDSAEDTPELISSKTRTTSSSISTLKSPFALRLILKSDELVHEPEDELRRKTSSLIQSPHLETYYSATGSMPKVSFSNKIQKVKSLLPPIADVVSTSQSAAMIPPTYSKNEIDQLMKSKSGSSAHTRDSAGSVNGTRKRNSLSRSKSNNDTPKKEESGGGILKRFFGKKK